MDFVYEFKERKKIKRLNQKESNKQVQVESEISIQQYQNMTSQREISIIQSQTDQNILILDQELDQKSQNSQIIKESKQKTELEQKDYTKSPINSAQEITQNLEFQKQQPQDQLKNQYNIQEVLKQLEVKANKKGISLKKLFETLYKTNLIQQNQNQGQNKFLIQEIVLKYLQKIQGQNEKHNRRIQKLGQFFVERIQKAE